MLNTLTFSLGLIRVRACRTATARVACPNPWEVAKQATLRGPDGSDSEEQLKVDEQLLGGDERASFFNHKSATGLLLGRVVNAENLIVGAFGCHGLGGRLNPDGYSEGAEGAVPGANARSLGRSLAEGWVATDEIGRMTGPDPYLGGDGQGTEVFERGGEGFLLVFGIEGQRVNPHEVESAEVAVPVLGGVWFPVVPALEVVGQAQADFEVQVGSVERNPVTCGVSHFAQNLSDPHG